MDILLRKRSDVHETGATPVVAEALFGVAGEAAARRALNELGVPLEQTLTGEIEAALRDSITVCRSSGDSEADRFDAIAILEHLQRTDPRLRGFLDPPVSVLAQDGIRAYWERVTGELLAPLGDPEVTGVGRSWADITGTNLDRVRREFVSILSGRLRRRRYSTDLGGLLDEAEHQEVILAVRDLTRRIDELTGTLAPELSSAERALRRYLRREARIDEKVGMKEVDHEADLFRIYVDVRAGSEWMDDCPVTELLLRDLPSERMRVVLEAPPGFGKTTAARYICQVHRLLHLSGNAEHGSPLAGLLGASPARLPIRIRCKQLAAWMAGLPNGDPISIDAYLAVEISRAGAPNRCAPDQVLQLLTRQRVLLVVDGHDEIRNDHHRRLATEALTAFVDEVDHVAAALQVIVTLRPAIYGRDEKLFEGYQRLSVKRLEQPEIRAFVRRWVRARETDDDDLLALERDALTKLEHPNVQALATNPMQLTILMRLAEQLADLPRHRTELYDQYVNIFFNREARKAPEVRANRQHLEALHEYIAWLLMSRMERGIGGGLTRDELDGVFAAYLGHAHLAPELITQLASGVERVFMLVSNARGEGYDFELESMKEYFCARRIYESAGTGTPGAPPTIGARLVALAARPAWLNTTRFYAGRYRRGELADIRYHLRNALRDTILAATGSLQVAALQLVADGVFDASEQARDLVDDLLVDMLDLHGVRHAEDDHELRRALMARAGSGLPAPLVVRLLEALAEYESFDAYVAAVHLLSPAADHPETRALMLRWWHEHSHNPAPAFDTDQWAELAGSIGIFWSLDTDEREHLVMNAESPGRVVFGSIWSASQRRPVVSMPPTWIDLAVEQGIRRLELSKVTPLWWHHLCEACRSDRTQRIQLLLDDFVRLREAPSLDVEHLDSIVEELSRLLPKSVMCWWLPLFSLRMGRSEHAAQKDARTPQVRLPFEARRNRHDPAWWPHRLESAASPGERMALCWLAIGTAPDDVMKTVEPVLDGALNVLPLQERSLLWTWLNDLRSSVVGLSWRTGVNAWWVLEDTGLRFATALHAAGIRLTYDERFVARALDAALGGDVEAAQFLLSADLAGTAPGQPGIDLLHISGRLSAAAFSRDSVPDEWNRLPHDRWLELEGDGRYLSQAVYRHTSQAVRHVWLASQLRLSDIAERDHWFTRVNLGLMA